MGTTITDPLVGQLVDSRYQVVSRIARGGMATVYLAVDRRLDREVALKVMHPHLAEGSGGADFVARFRREARAAARLTHPGLVAVFDQGLDGETSYLTMEYVPGGNLRRRLSERGSLTVADALDMTEQVLDALSAAHRAGLVHRDIKPENVLLTAEDRIKVGDFGLARAVTEVTSATTGTVLGTVAYLAPELVTRGASDARTDVYAAGVLLYEAITGRQPFTGETPIQVAFQHVNDDVPPPSEVADWLPTEVDALVGALAARDPDDRPADAAAALALVRRTRAELDEATLARRTDVEPTAAAVPPSDDDSGSLAAESDAAGDAATSRIEALSRGGTVALPIGLGVEPATEPADSPTDGTAPRRRRWALISAAVLLLAAIAGGIWWYTAAGPGAYTTVPQIQSLTADEARAALDDAGLGVTVEEVFDDEAAVGTVVDSDPGSGERVRKEGTVTVSVSKGPDLVSVPEGLAGALQADAETALAAAGFSVEYDDPEHSDDVANGLVLSVIGPDGQPAEAGAQLKRGTTVVLTVSSGPAPVTVISVIGATVEAATEQLADAGLQIAPEEVFSDTVPAGSVVSQSPEPGAAAHRTDTVTVQVSKGPELVTVPNLRGKQFEEAQQILQDLGLTAERQNVLGGIFGTVRDQSVAADTQVAKGSTVTLTVV
ncbi:Stk1 family PASTA domain-containing Ser/Thr kinase [Cellulomonas sp. NPDC089187]|uniref:Stk1 family PASTA domain-containing Ser/Thr kinase n=1 Tax=Cellulomonas sp. NPDC089187 TaxID=3154970 RepID=UPI003416AD30